MRIGEVPIDHLIDEIEDLPIGLVVVPKPFFFFYRFALVIQILSLAD